MRRLCVFFYFARDWRAVAALIARKEEKKKHQQWEKGWEQFVQHALAQAHNFSTENKKKAKRQPNDEIHKYMWNCVCVYVCFVYLFIYW